MTNSKPSKQELEEGRQLLPQFDSIGLITAVVSQASTGAPLMVAYMNAEALDLTLQTGEAHFFSRSRQEIWHKGGTSGNVLEVSDVLIDCDQDVLWLKAEPKGHGAACHTGQKSCFYRRVITENGQHVLERTGAAPLFDPNDVYGA